MTKYLIVLTTKIGDYTLEQNVLVERNLRVELLYEEDLKIIFQDIYDKKQNNKYLVNRVLSVNRDETIKKMKQ